MSDYSEELKALNPTDPGQARRLYEIQQALINQAEQINAAHKKVREEKVEVDNASKGNVKEVVCADEITPVLSKLADSIVLSNVSDTVKSFNGNPRELNKWIKSIEKHVLFTSGSLQSPECVKVAFKTSKNTVSDFISRALSDKKPVTWDILKSSLTERFGEKLDTQTLLLRLRKYVQRPDQGVQVFAEVILTKAAEIYKKDDDLNHWIVQKELISIFVKGLRSKAVARKVLAKDPQDLDAALDAALEATSRDIRLKAHGLVSNSQDLDVETRVEEPMDVSEVTTTPGKSKSYSAQSHRTSRNTWTPEGKPICNYCKGINHMYRDCLKRKEKRATQYKSPQDGRYNGKSSLN